MSKVVVIGAGLAGLSAARRLVDAGHEVVVLDKGRSPGGRMATRRIGDAVVDHGAQFFTTRSDEFAALVASMVRDGVVVEWCRGFGDGDGHPRYRGVAGMNSVAKHLARGLDVRCETMAFQVQPDGRIWSVQDDRDHRIAADAVIVTAPIPQAIALCVDVRERVPEALWRTAYQPTLTLLAVLDGASAVPTPGGVNDVDETFSFIADNKMKGLSPVTSLTMHARAEFSDTHWNHAGAHDLLRAAAAPWFGSAAVVTTQLKKWRYATPTNVWADRCCVIGGLSAPLILAGDAYAGPKVEGAVVSGWAAADAVIAGA